MRDSASVVTAKQCASCKRIFRTKQEYLLGTLNHRVCDRKGLWFNCRCGSTLYLPQGKYSWYAVESFLSIEAKVVYAALPRKSEIPPVPGAVAKAQELLTDDNTDATQIAEVLREVPLCAAELLTITNGMGKKFPAPITSLEHAVAYVGRRRVSELLTTASLRMVKPRTLAFSSAAFWRESMVTGRTAALLAQLILGEEFEDRAYLAGTLCNIGKLIGAICEPKAVDQAFLSAVDPEKGHPWIVAENRHRATSHLVLGEIGAVLWGLPQFIKQSITAHHDHPIDNEPARIESVVALANQMSHLVLENPQRVERPLLKGLLTLFRIQEQQVPGLVEQYRSQIGSIAQ